MKTPLTPLLGTLVVLLTLLCPATGWATQPPAADLKLWLRADTGVNTNQDGTVNAWADQAQEVKHDGVSAGDTQPVWTVNPNFPGGGRPVIRFDGRGAFVLDNRHDLDMPAASVYVVAMVDPTVTSGIFIANLRDPYGFALGMSDSVAGRARWYTGVPANSMEPAAAKLAAEAAYLIEGTIVGSVKQMFLNGARVGNATGQALNNATWSALTVGCQGVYPAVGDLETGDPPVLSKYLTGDIAEILVYSSVSEAQRLAVEAYLAEKYLAQRVGAPVITAGPSNQQINERQPSTFTVKADGALPLTYRWFKNGVALSSTNGPIYSIASVQIADAGTYSVVVSNAVGVATSAEAQLTVIPDKAPPTLLSADRDFLTNTAVTVVFSEPVSGATATLPANYSIDNGITVNRVVQGDTPDTVVLITSPISFGPAYTVTVNGVRDLPGNPIAAGSSRRVTVPDPNAPVPTSNLKLWLRADLGVTAQEDGTVTAWADHQVGNPAKNGTAVGQPMLGQAQFVNGLHPVITFDGHSGFILDHREDLKPTNMTFFIVASISTLNLSRVAIGQYRDVAGWCVGISDTIEGRTKWFTAPPNSMEPDGAQLTENTPILLTASYLSVGGIKKLYVNTNLVGAATGVNLAYASDTQLTVGYLQGNRQYWTGDIAEILVYSAVSDSQRARVEAYLNRKYFGQSAGPATLVTQPQSQTVNELQSVTFEVVCEGDMPIALQWYKNGAAIPEATNTAYYLPSVTRLDNQASFSVRASNSRGSVQSSNALLTVVADTTAPQLVLAKRDYLEAGQLVVVFSKLVTAASGTQAANYGLSSGATVTQAAVGPDASTVILTTSPLAAGTSYTLTVNGVRDLVGNEVQANSRVAVRMPVSAALPPTANRVLWLAADAGVTTADGARVTQWSDRAGGTAPHHSSAVVGSPQLALADFPNGRNLVVRFNGASGFVLENPRDLDLQDFSISLVGSVNNTVASEMFIANWQGMGFGISDSLPGVVKWVSYGPYDSMEPADARLENGVPYVLTGTFQAGVSKTFYVNGKEVASAAEPSIAYTEAPLVVGMIGENGSQFLQGDIAEILVYSAVSNSQRVAVEDYLNQKYFLGGATEAPRLTLQRAQDRVTLSWPVAAAGFALQSTDRLAPTAVWQLETAAVTANGDQYTVSLPIANTSRFYRLSQ